MTKDYSWTDILPMGEVLLIGTAEIAHLWGIFLHRSFSECVMVFGILAGVFLAAALISVVVLISRKKFERRSEKSPLSEKVLLLLFCLLAVSQILYVAAGENIYRQGDMTVETVGSFLENNGLYLVNPLTGQAYREGIPSRLKILCLPTLYGALCSIFRTDPGKMVWQIVPVITLLGCYGAYACLGKSLFPDDGRKRKLFLVAVAALLWAGAYSYGMDGFGVLYAGWRGVTIRNCVLLPYIFSLCIRKKHFPLLLCVAAEACIVWTLYGLGAGAAVILGMLGIGYLERRKKKADT